MQKWILANLVPLVAILTGCGQPKVNLTYPTGVNDLIIQASSTGGLVPDAFLWSYIPEFRLYGDGRVVWSQWQDGRTHVWEGTLTANEVTDLLEWIASKGFFGMEHHYSVKNPPTDLPTDCVSVNVAEGKRTVCEYHDGAPRGFGEIEGRLRAGADARDVHAYVPEIGWVVVEPITWDSTREPVAWPQELTPDPLAMGSGTWVKGEVLDFLWEGRLEQGPWMVYKVGNERYGLVLQIPELMLQAPEAP